MPAPGTVLGLRSDGQEPLPVTGGADSPRGPTGASEVTSQPTHVGDEKGSPDTGSGLPTQSNVYRDVAQLAPRRKTWAESDSDEDLPSVFDELDVLEGGRSRGDVIVLPDDMETYFSGGYTALKKAAEVVGYKVLSDSNTKLADAGIQGFGYLSLSKEEARDFLDKQSEHVKTGMTTLKSLVWFVRALPNKADILNSVTQLSAAYALHFIPLEAAEGVNEATYIRRSLKHPDGGRSLIQKRIYALCSRSTVAMTMILVAIERLLRANARLKARALDADLAQLVRLACFTTTEGLLQSFYRKESRDVNRQTEVIDNKGRVTKKLVKVRVNGFNLPNLPCRSDFLTSTEKRYLLDSEAPFNNMIEKCKTFTNEIIIGKTLSEATTIPARVAEAVVKASYDALKPINDLIKVRKSEVRNLAISMTKDIVTPVVYAQALRDASQKWICEEATMRDALGHRDNMLRGYLDKL